MKFNSNFKGFLSPLKPIRIPLGLRFLDYRLIDFFFYIYFIHSLIHSSRKTCSSWYAKKFPKSFIVMWTAVPRRLRGGPSSSGRVRVCALCSYSAIIQWGRFFLFYRELSYLVWCTSVASFPSRWIILCRSVRAFLPRNTEFRREHKISD